VDSQGEKKGNEREACHESSAGVKYGKYDDKIKNIFPNWPAPIDS
jgi:hypothetical protein